MYRANRCLAWLLAGTFVLIAVGACGSQPPGDVPKTTIGPTEAARSEVPPTASPSETASPPPTATATPTLTPTATPVKKGSEAIAGSNATQIQELRRWGAGEIEKAFLGTNGQYMTIETKIGAYIRRQDSLALVHELPGAVDTAVSPDLKWLAVSYPEGHIEFWELAEPKLVASVAHDVEWPKYPPADFDRDAFVRPLEVVFSPDSDHVAVSYGNGEIALLSAAQGSMVYVLRSGIAPFPTRLLFTPDGKYLLSLDEGHGAFWEVATGRIVSDLRNLNDVPMYPFSPDGTKLLSTQWGGRVDVFGVPHGEAIKHFGTGLARVEIEYSRNGDYYLIYGGYQVRDEKDGQLILGVIANDVVQDHFSGISISEEEARKIGAYSGLFELRTNTDGGLDCWALNGRAVTRWSVLGNAIEMFELPDVGARTSYRGGFLRVNRVQVSRDATRIGSCTSENLFVVDIVDDEIYLLPGCNSYGGFGFTPDGQGVWIANRELPGSKSAIYEYGIADGELRHTISVHSQTVYMMEYLGDGSRMLTSSQTYYGGNTYLWSTDPLYKIAQISGIHEELLAAETTPDGNYLVTVDSVVRVFDLRSLAQIKIISGDPTAIAISANGGILAIGTAGGNIRLVTLPGGDDLALLEGHQGRLVDLVFSGDMRALYSASTDGTVRLWCVP